MKKVLISLLFIIMLFTQPAIAKSVKVTAMEPFSSLNPVSTLKVITLERIELKNGIVLEEGTLIKGDIFDVKQPKRGKLNASFKFKPVYYSYNGKNYKITNENLYAKYAPYKEIDATQIAISTATTVGGFFLNVPGFGQMVSFGKGFVNDPEGNRLKSGAKQVYKDSPVSYVEEGKDVSIKKDEMFILKFKVKGKDDENDKEEYSLEADEVEKDVVNNLQNNESTEVQASNFAPAAQSVDTPTPSVTNKFGINPIYKPVDPYSVLDEVNRNNKK